MKIGHTTDKPTPLPAAASGTKSLASPASPSGPNVTTEPVKSQPPTAAIPAKADASAKIELSSTAATLLSGSSAPEFDTAKVAAVSKAIEEGSFKINPESIADKLIANAQELLSKTSANAQS